MLAGSGEESLRRFIAEHMAAEVREARSEKELIEMLQGIRHSLAGTKLQGALKTGPSSAKLVLVSESGERHELAYELEPDAPHGLLKLFIDSGGESSFPDVEENMSDREMAEALRTHMKELVDAGRFSGAVLLAKDGEVLFQEAYGLASKRYDMPNRIDTKFNLGSMNKMFTAVAIVQLAEKGKLDFNDFLIEHVPDYPNREVAEKVTIHHLLTHTSGMGSYWNEKFEATWPRIRTVDDLIPLFAGDPLHFEPGARFEYSNSGFAVLGLVVEKVTAQSYYDYVRENIYEPAGMSDTDCYEMDRPVRNLAIGYTRMGPEGHQESPGPRRNNLFMHTVKGGPAGGGFSTVGDMLRFSEALRSHKLLSPESTETLLTGRVDMAPDRKYAYGFGDSLARGHRFHGHTGGAPGINAVFRFFPDLGYTYVALANYDEAAMPVDRFVQEMITRR
jgi:CubicO group peptidase (beta-lactamase class C family)